MQGSPAELDFMLKDAGSSVVFSRAGVRLAATYGLLDTKQIIGQADGGFAEIGRDVTLVIRDGTQGALQVNDAATIGATAYRVRDLGDVDADGTRTLMLAAA
jgi:hypothetical protein